MFVKVKLKVFIGEIDAELFEAVLREVFESKDVED